MDIKVYRGIQFYKDKRYGWLWRFQKIAGDWYPFANEIGRGTSFEKVCVYIDTILQKENAPISESVS